MNIQIEKFNYDLFVRNYTNFRYSQIPNKFTNITDSKLQLPTKSTLHMCNEFLSNGDTENIYPDLNNVFIEQETYLKYLSFITPLLTSDTLPFKIQKTTFIFRPTMYYNALLKYQRELKGYKRVINEDSVKNLKNALLIKDYTRFLQPRFNGSLKYYYKFEYLLRTLLNDIVNSNDDRSHYIYLPLSETPYSKAKFIQAFGGISKSALKNIIDFSYYLELHILGFIYAQTKPFTKVGNFPWDDPETTQLLTSTSLFSRLPEEMLPNINLILYRGSRAVVYNLKQIKEFANNPSFVNLVITQFFKLKGYSTDTNSFSEEEVETSNEPNLDEIDTNKVIISPNDTSEEDVVVNNKGKSTTDEIVDAEIKKLSTSDKIAVSLKNQPVSKHADKLYSVKRFKDKDSEYNEKVDISDDYSDIDLKDFEDDDVDIDSLMDDVSDLIYDHPITEVVEKSTPEKKEQVLIYSEFPLTDYTKKVEDDINTYISINPTVTPTDIARVKKLIPLHMNTKINGTPIGELLSTYTPDIKPVKLEHLDDVVSNKDMLESRIADFDKNYVNELLKSDLAKTLTSITSQGLFIHSSTENMVDDGFSKYTEYKFKLVDIKGKKHNIAFTLPTIDERGNLLLSGIQSKLIKQQVNLPICKVSEYRVNLSSNYNKTLVERTQSKINRFDNYLKDYLQKLVNLGLITVEFGDEQLPSSLKLPFEYGVVKSKYQKITFDKFKFVFNYNKRIDSFSNEKELNDLEKDYGVFVGSTSKGELLFWNNDDYIKIVNRSTNEVINTRFISILNHLYESKLELPKICSEYTTLKVLDKTFPVIFVLGYKYGLSEILRYLDIKHEFFPKGKRVKRNSIYDIVIPFKDGKLVFNRYPLAKSLIISGLAKLNTKTVTFNEMNGEDAYYRLLMDKNISINYLKGISSFFDFFVDPITEEVLLSQGEPTNVRDLLIRSTELLSTLDYYPSSSLRHFRLRGYERFSSVLYNEISRKLSAYNNNKSVNKTFSINPEAVFQRIVQDNSMQNIDVINPVHELKYDTQVTFTGSGGRTAQSFVINDRVYPEDGVGIMSEATPDSGKVGMTVFTSANPNITNLRGMYDSNVDNDNPKTPMETLSVVGNLMPCLSQDDSKRVSFTSIQLSHHVPCENGEVCRVRTEYEKVIPSFGSDVFVVMAKQSGTVVDIDDQKQTMTLQYDDELVSTSGNIDLSYRTLEPNTKVSGFVSNKDIGKYKVGEQYTINKNLIFKITDIVGTSIERLTPDDKEIYNKLSKTFKDDKLFSVIGTISSNIVKGGKEVYCYIDKYTAAAGETLRQSYNTNVKKGERVNKGDVLIYNKGFYIPDPYSKQVSWKHGVMATVALIDMPENEEDGCRITSEFGEKMKMDSVHVRNVTIDNLTAVSDIVDLGQYVNVNDRLCNITNNAVDVLSQNDDDDTLEFLSELNTNSPKAHYSGTVVDIRLYYTGSPDNLHESIKTLAKKLYKREKEISNLYKDTNNKNSVQYVRSVPLGMKYKSLEFIEGMVVIEFTISNSLNSSIGDKQCLMSANKTVISDVMEKPPISKSGIPIDFLFSTTSIDARIVWSPKIVGGTERVLEKVEDIIVDMYFN